MLGSVSEFQALLDSPEIPLEPTRTYLTLTLSSMDCAILSRGTDVEYHARAYSQPYENQLSMSSSARVGMMSEVGL